MLGERRGSARGGARGQRLEIRPQETAPEAINLAALLDLFVDHEKLPRAIRAARNSIGQGSEVHMPITRLFQLLEHFAALPSSGMVKLSALTCDAVSNVPFQEATCVALFLASVSMTSAMFAWLRLNISTDVAAVVDHILRRDVVQIALRAEEAVAAPLTAVGLGHAWIAGM